MQVYSLENFLLAKDKCSYIRSLKEICLTNKYMWNELSSVDLDKSFICEFANYLNWPKLLSKHTFDEKELNYYKKYYEKESLTLFSLAQNQTFTYDFFMKNFNLLDNYLGIILYFNVNITDEEKIKMQKTRKLIE